MFSNWFMNLTDFVASPHGARSNYVTATVKVSNVVVNQNAQNLKSSFLIFSFLQNVAWKVIKASNLLILGLVIFCLIKSIHLCGAEPVFPLSQEINAVGSGVRISKWCDGPYPASLGAQQYVCWIWIQPHFCWRRH